MNAMIVETNMAGTSTETNDHNINPDRAVGFAATIFDCKNKTQESRDSDGSSCNCSQEEKNCQNL